MRFEFKHYRELRELLEAERLQHATDQETIVHLRERLDYQSARRRESRETNERLTQENVKLAAANREHREKLANGDQWCASLEVELTNAKAEIERLHEVIRWSA